MVEPAVTIEEFDQFIPAVHGAWQRWGTAQLPWFRGEPSGGERFEPLLPKVYREQYDENALLQFFRMKAPLLGLPHVPLRGEVDKWLFIARHVGLPTRILDWTEGALIALYFALHEEGWKEPEQPERRPTVWMLDPMALNAKTAGGGVPNQPYITWGTGNPEVDKVNVGSTCIRSAWEPGFQGFRLPVAITPTNIYPRMAAQRSCFTVHGYERWGVHRLVGEDCLKGFTIAIPPREGLQRLYMVGITHSTLFPEAEGLARELDMLYRQDGLAVP